MSLPLHLLCCCCTSMCMQSTVNAHGIMYACSIGTHGAMCESARFLKTWTRWQATLHMSTGERYPPCPCLAVVLLPLVRPSLVYFSALQSLHSPKKWIYDPLHNAVMTESQTQGRPCLSPHLWMPSSSGSGWQ